MVPSRQDANKEAVVRDEGEDAYVRWRLAWEKRWASEDRRIQELDQRIEGVRNTLPQRGRSRSPGPGMS